MSEISRRTFLTIGSLSVVACAADQREVAPLDLSEETRTTAPLFLNKPERDFVAAAAERMIPTDELGPGAIAAGVPEFIDRQLGGSYGQAVTWYMEGPWHKGSEEQGYQSKLTPSQMYRAAIPAIDKHCSDKYKRRFAELGPSDQDAVLKELEGGKIEL